MAKTVAARKGAGALATFTPPKGSREVRSARLIGDFLNFTKPGESVEGILIGTHPVRNATTQKDVDRFVLLDVDGNLWILPDHYDLGDKLQTIEHGTKVYVQYLGKQRVKTKRFPRGMDVAKYGIADLGSPDAGARKLIEQFNAGKLVGSNVATPPPASDDVPF